MKRDIYHIFCEFGTARCIFGHFILKMILLCVTIYTMRILFYRYNSICEPDMIGAFRSFGLTVTEERSEMEKKDILNGERVSIVSSYLRDQGDEPYLFVFSVNFFPALSDTCSLFNVPYVCWSVDSPLAEIYTKSVLNPCNRLFLFDRVQLQELEDKNPGHIFHLPLCTGSARWQSVISSVTADDRKRFHSDISFIGSLYTEKDPYLHISSLSSYSKGYCEGLVASQLQLTGCNILEDALEDKVAAELAKCCAKEYPAGDVFIKDMSRYIAGEHILGMHASSLYRIRILKRLSEHFRVDLYTNSPDAEQLMAAGHSGSKDADSRAGLTIMPGVSTLYEMPKIFHLSKINLNLTIYPIRSGLPLRVWDVLGCGGFLLTNMQPEIMEHFVPGEDLDIFTCEEELTEKCAFYLSHDDLRQRIARNGHEKVAAHHTYEIRFSQMLKVIMSTVS